MSLKNKLLTATLGAGLLVGASQVANAQQPVTKVTTDSLKIHLQGDAVDKVSEAIMKNADQFETEIGNKSYGVIREYIPGTNGYNDSVKVGFIIPQIYWMSSNTVISYLNIC